MYRLYHLILYTTQIFIEMIQIKNKIQYKYFFQILNIYKLLRSKKTGKGSAKYLFLLNIFQILFLFESTIHTYIHK